MTDTCVHDGTYVQGPHFRKVLPLATRGFVAVCHALDMSISNRPALPAHLFCSMAIGVMALILICTGSDGVGNLHSFAVITAMPVALVLLPFPGDALPIRPAKQRAVTQPVRAI